MKIKNAAKSGTGSCTLKSGVLGMSGAYETTDIRFAEVSDGR